MSLSYTLVFVQFAALLVIAFSGPLLLRQPLSLALAVAAILLGLWAILAMRPGYFNILPDPKPNGRLVRAGPYRWIRHPMYAALLLLSLALVLNAPSWWRGLVWLLLLVNLLVKLNYEESLLAKLHPEYSSYQAQSRRLVPFLY
jgi:protein-S-isoprenylcysteine O-methyltransferase Ste14